MQASSTHQDLTDEIAKLEVEENNTDNEPVKVKVENFDIQRETTIIEQQVPIVDDNLELEEETEENDDRQPSIEPSI